MNYKPPQPQSYSAETAALITQLKDRIKRLEEAGDDLYANCDPSRWDSAATAARKLSDQNAWLKAKEAKP